ncbi:MAG: GDP-mannose 4,6-dehydratase [Acidobacteria bacterium]|nr:GDP-mannose 4,6-dehydratase [Acidobacteriota bacterium]
MKILLTGVAGFIGSNLGEALLEEKNEIVGIDNFDSYYSREIKEKNLLKLNEYRDFHFLEIDLRDKHSLKALLEQGFDVVVHLAGRGGVRRSILEPQQYVEMNYIATLNLLEVMKETDVKKIVFASTSSVYGNKSEIPFREDKMADWPISPYSASKKACEALLYTYHHIYGFDVYALRFFTVYGRRQRPDMAIYKLVKAIVNEEVFEKYGDGKTERDYTYIDDIVSGVAKAAQSVKGYEIINIGGSRTVELNKLISLAEEIIGKKAIVIEKPIPEGDVIRTYADVSKAQKLLDFSPKVKIEEGLTNFVEWFLKENKK